MIKIYNKNDFVNMIKRSSGSDIKVTKKVRAIIADVIKRGDQALIDYTAKLDKLNISRDNMLVSKSEIEECVKRVAPELMAALKRAHDNIVRLNEAHKPADNIIGDSGKRVGYLVRPMERAGIYVPGGKSPYPSSVLM